MMRDRLGSLLQNPLVITTASAYDAPAVTGNSKTGLKPSKPGWITVRTPINPVKTELRRQNPIFSPSKNTANKQAKTGATKKHTDASDTDTKGSDA